MKASSTIAKSRKRVAWHNIMNSHELEISTMGKIFTGKDMKINVQSKLFHVIHKHSTQLLYQFMMQYFLREMYGSILIIIYTEQINVSLSYYNFNTCCLNVTLFNTK